MIWTTVHPTFTRFVHLFYLFKRSHCCKDIFSHHKVCSPEGYLAHQGYSIDPVRAIIPRLQRLLAKFRLHDFPIYHTREGHRPDLSTLSPREHFRSKNNESKLGIGDLGPLGRLLVRGEPGHDIISELCPMTGENIIDKPGRSAFQHTEFKLMLDIKGIRNLILCGVTTDVCVHSTMREANDNGFDCLILEDVTAAAEECLHISAIKSVEAEGGIFGAVSTSRDVLYAIDVVDSPSRRSSYPFEDVPGKTLLPNPHILDQTR